MLLENQYIFQTDAHSQKYKQETETLMIQEMVRSSLISYEFTFLCDDKHQI